MGLFVAATGGTAVGAKKQETLSTYWNTLIKSLWVKPNSRNGLVLIDSVNPANSPSIKLSCIFTPSSSAPYGGIKTGIVPDANTIYIFRGTSFYQEGNGSGFYFKTEEYGGLRWGFKWGDKDGLSHTNKFGTSNVIVDSNWHTIIIYDKRLWLCNPDISLTDASILNIIATQTPLINLTTALWVDQTNQIVLLVNYAFTVAASCYRSLTWVGNLTGGAITWQKKYIFSNNLNVYDILGGGIKTTVLTNAGSASVGNASVMAYSPYGFDNLTEGHTSGYKAGSPSISIPKSVNGYIADLPTGYVKLHDHASDLLNHNLADSKIHFVAGSIWDRSSAAAWADACRTAWDYDALNPTDWHISNINALQLYEWLNTDYKYILGSNFSPNSVDVEERLTLKELFSFNANLTQAQMYKVWKYTNDYDLIVI